MLSKSILLQFKMIAFKIIYILMVSIFLLCLLYYPVQAAQYTEKYTSSSSLNSKLYPRL